MARGAVGQARAAGVFPAGRGRYVRHPLAVAGVGSAPAAAYAASEDGISEEKGGSCSGDSSPELGLPGGRGPPPRWFGLGRWRVRGFMLESLPLSAA